MTLLSLVEQLSLERDVTPDYVYQLRLVVRNFGKHLEREPTAADFTDEAVNRWLVALDKSGLAKRTLRSKRNHLLALWRFAVDAKATAVSPDRVRVIKCPRLIPDATPAAQLAKLLDIADGLKGVFKKSKVPRAAFWRAFVLVSWETGLRLKDLLRIERDWIDAAGVLTLSQNKTGWPIICQLSPACVAAIEATFTGTPARSQIFGDALGRRCVQEQFARMLALVGLKGGTKRIRRSGATAAEMACPGAAMSYLGHRTPGLAYQFYVDPRLTAQRRQSPPPLE